MRSLVPEGSPSTIRPDEQEAADAGEKTALAKVEAWHIAKQSMIDFGLEIAERYSKDSAVLEYEKGLSVFFPHRLKAVCRPGCISW